MLPVEIVPVDGTTIVLRARGSELLILPHHIGQLKSCKNPKDFTGYFLTNALLNRPARKLFEAWLRKDKSLWQRIYRTVQTDMDTTKIKEFEERMSNAESAEPATEKKAESKLDKSETKKKETVEDTTKKKAAAPTKANAKEEADEKPKKKAAAPAAKKKDVKEKSADKPKKDTKKAAPAAKKASAAKPKKK